MISKDILNLFGQTIEKLHGEGGANAIEKWCKTHDFTDGALEGIEFIGGTGCNRIAMALGDTFFKVVREVRAVPQNKFEVFIMKNCKDEAMIRHLPELLGHSLNYWVTATKRVDFPAQYSDFEKDPDFKAFKKLGLGTDVGNNNVLWSKDRNTWVIVDLGLPSSDRALAAAIENIRNGRDIFHNFKSTHEDHCR